MGTSTPYSGPTGLNPLLPPWADEEPGPNDNGNPNDDDGDQGEPAHSPQSTAAQASVAWSAPKAGLTRWVRGTGSRTLGPVARNYVAASGGSRTAARAAGAGRSSTVRLGRFLTAGARGGFAAAAATILGLRDLIGHDAQFVLAAVIDAIAPVGTLREDAIARVAMIETLAELFERCDVEAGGFTALDALDADGIGDIIKLSVVNYVYTRFQQELVSRIELGTTSERVANDLIAQAKEFFATVLRLDLASVDVLAIDWSGHDGQRIVTQLYEAAYALLGGEQ